MPHHRIGRGIAVGRSREPVPSSRFTSGVVFGERTQEVAPRPGETFELRFARSCSAVRGDGRSDSRRLDRACEQHRRERALALPQCFRRRVRGGRTRARRARRVEGAPGLGDGRVRGAPRPCVRLGMAREDLERRFCVMQCEPGRVLAERLLACTETSPREGLLELGLVTADLLLDVGDDRTLGMFGDEFLAQGEGLAISEGERLAV